MSETPITVRHDGGVDETTYIIGAGGQLGRALLSCRPDGRAVRALTSADIDITDADSVRAALAGLHPGDVVINCAAYTAVDAAESDAERARAVNRDGAENLARITAEVGARLIQVSTDYVFSGAVQAAPFEPDDVAASPATVYGVTKLEGERAVLAADPRAVVVRTAWVYTGADGDKDFVGTMRRLERERAHVDVVDDQTGSPTLAPDLAAGLWELAAHPDPPHGVVVHATNAGAATWFDVARAVFAEIGADPGRVHPCTTADFPRPAPRPAYSVLSGASWAAAGLTPLRPWRDALRAAVAEHD